MKLSEMIKVMQHFEDGGEVEYSGDNFETLSGKANNKKNPNGLSWDWSSLQYRIKQQKQKVTIEKWLIKNIDSGEHFIMESSDIDLTLKDFPDASCRVKLMEIYEVEL